MSKREGDEKPNRKSAQKNRHEAGRTMGKLRRVVGRKWIGGVCAGVAYWLGAPTWLIRLIWVVLGFCYGIGIVPYLLLWIFMPRWDPTPDDYGARSGG